MFIFNTGVLHVANILMCVCVCIRFVGRGMSVYYNMLMLSMIYLCIDSMCIILSHI